MHFSFMTATLASVSLSTSRACVEVLKPEDDLPPPREGLSTPKQPRRHHHQQFGSMFNKIIKHGERKVSKSESSSLEPFFPSFSLEPSSLSSSPFPSVSASPSTSLVSINHAFRSTTNVVAAHSLPGLHHHCHRCRHIISARGERWRWCSGRCG